MLSSFQRPLAGLAVVLALALLAAPAAAPAAKPAQRGTLVFAFHPL
jgi:hypothetical protein